MLAKATLLAAGLGALGLLAAGCGGGKPAPGVASLGPSTTTTASQTPVGGGAGQSPAAGGNATAFVAFADCMQKHGVPVQVASGGKGISINGGGGPNAPQMQKAQAACQKLLPGGGPKPLTPAEQVANNKALLVLATCMRSHGYPNFPDPNGQGIFNLTGSSGFDPSSTQFQTAMTTCQPKGAKLRIGIRAVSGGPAPAGAGGSVSGGKQ